MSTKLFVSPCRQKMPTFLNSWDRIAAGWIAGAALFVAGWVLASRFLQAEELAEMLRWGAASALAFAGLALVKVWFWLELQKNAVVREVKRLEVQVASLAAELHRQ